MPEDLEREGFVTRLPYDEKNVLDAMALAHRDLRTARSIRETRPDGR